MDDIIELISEFDSRINAPEVNDDIQELTAVRDTLIARVIKQYKVGDVIDDIPLQIVTTGRSGMTGVKH